MISPLHIHTNKQSNSKYLIILSLLVPSPLGSPLGRSEFRLKGTQFANRADVNDYMISCVRLASELSKGSPSLSLKYIKEIFPFLTCWNIIKD